MRLTRTAAIALRDLVNHAFRSFLTALGVVFGVGAVVAMMAISEGARLESLERITALGTDTILVRSVKPSTGAAAESSGRSMAAAEFGVTAADIRHIRSIFENVRYVVPVRDTRKPIRIRGEMSDIHAFATTPEFLALSRTELIDPRSRLFTAEDDENGNPVCLVGRRAARKLFSFRDPLGATVRVGASSFRVIGIFDNRYSARMLGERDLNNQILLPLGTAEAFFTSTSRSFTAGSVETVKVEADFLYVKVIDMDLIENTAARLRSYFRQTHEEVDYEVEVPYEELELMRSTQRISEIVMASIASISLLVGGIGIMNIMMANIYERTREIGTRRALGARKRDILVQFLVEAVLLTAIGGLIGVAVGFGLAQLVTLYAGMRTVVSLLSVLVSFGVSVLVGVVFGTYPAWKAANLDPIAALRSE